MNKTHIDQLLEKPTFDYQKFHARTKIKKMEKEVGFKSWSDDWKNIHYKAYGRFGEIKLPKPLLNKKIQFVDILFRRQSVREFSKNPLSAASLSNLFYYSTGIHMNNSKFSGRRFYPSAGGVFPLEVYMLSINTDLPPASYHYYVKNNSFEKMFFFKRKDLSLITNTDWVKTTGCLILITAVFKRNTSKYGDRGYRHILTEAGHMAQNFYLVSTALGLACCAIGGYIDDNINKLLDIDGLNESIIYVLVVGNSKKPLIGNAK